VAFAELNGSTNNSRQGRQGCATLLGNLFQITEVPASRRYCRQDTL